MKLKNKSLVLDDSLRTRITSTNRIELNKRCKELEITPSELLRNYARYIIAGGQPICSQTD